MTESTDLVALRRGVRSTPSPVEAAAVDFVRADRIAREFGRASAAPPLIARAQREREQARLALVVAVGGRR